MRVLFLVPYVPNLVRVRPYNFIRYLSQRGHDVTVFTVWSDEHERQDLEKLKTECYAVRAVHLPKWRSLGNCLLALPGRAPLQAAYCWHPELVAECALAGLQPDVIHVEHLRGAWYGLRLKAWLEKKKSSVPLVWDSVDSISLLFRQAASRSRRWVSRLITAFELGRTESYESWLTAQFRTVVVTSPADRDALATLAARAGRKPDLRVIPNGVDLDYFGVDLGLSREPDTLVLSGKMSYHANVTMAIFFVREVLPLVRARRPSIKVWIVGKDPAPEVRALASDPAVTVTGSVPDVRPYLQRATLAVAPVAYGVGIQNKVLEAMACGTPVVATRQAVSALQVQPGRDVVVADGPAALAEKTLELLEQPTRREAVGRAGRAYVEAHHDWRNIVSRLEESYHVHSNNPG
ncbi:MAG: glycosyltransferase [Anaerolineales bacterium]|nr:glycosyltransferase [Anaerolineales bacterium]